MSTASPSTPTPFSISAGRSGARSGLRRHLIGLHLVLDRGHPPPRHRILPGILPRLAPLRWLEPARPNGTLTVEHVLAARSGDDHHDRVRVWAANVWAGVIATPQTVRTWPRRAFSEPPTKDER